MVISRQGGLLKNGCLVFISFFLVQILASQPAFSLCVKSGRANLRGGPGTQYSKTWEVYRYMPFRKIRSRGSWIHIIDVDGAKHWIHKSLVTSSYYCAVVKKSKINLRSGPGTRHSKIGSAEKYYSFKVLKILKRWVKVIDEYGDQQWVARSLIWIN